MKTNKATDNKGIATEMLKALPYQSGLTMNRLFNSYHNNGTPSPDSWTHSTFEGLPKDKHSITLEQFRWIVKMSLTRQWYQRCNRDSLRSKQRTTSSVRTYGFKQSIQPGNITGWLRGIIKHCSRWKGYQAIIISLDIKTYFDALDHQTIHDAATNTKTNAHTINATTKDYSHKTASLKITHDISSEFFDFTKGGWQGGSATPDNANIVLEHYLDSMIQKWQKEGTGYHITDDNGAKHECNHAIWADNVFLIANNTEEAQTMLDEITAKLQEIDLHWKAKDVAFMTVGDIKDDLIDLRTWLDGDPDQLIPQNTTLTVLGTQLDQTGTTHTSYHYRQQKAERVFWKYYRQTKHSKASQATKIDAWLSTSVKSALYDSGNWDVTVDILTQMRTWELHHLRKLFTTPWQATRAEHMQTSAYIIDEIRQKTKQPHLLHVFIDEVINNTYQQYNTTDQHGRNLTHETRQHRDRAWWNHMKQAPHHIRKTMVDKATHRRVGFFTEHEDFINTLHTDCNNVTHDWRKDVTTMTKREWQASCKNRVNVYLKKHKLPKDPRKKATQQHNNNTKHNNIASSNNNSKNNNVQ